MPKTMPKEMGARVGVGVGAAEVFNVKQVPANFTLLPIRTITENNLTEFRGKWCEEYAQWHHQATHNREQSYGAFATQGDHKRYRQHRDGPAQCSEQLCRGEGEEEEEAEKEMGGSVCILQN